MNKWAHIAGIAFSIIFGFSFMFSKILLNQVSPMGVIAYRFLVAFLFFELLRRAKIIKINARFNKFLPILIVGVFQPVAYFIFETYGLNKTTSAEAGLMIALIPIFVTIFSAFILKEKPKILQVLFILVSFIGVVIIQLFKPNINFQADLLGFIFLLLAVLSAAAFNIASRIASKTSKPQETTYFMMFLGMITFNMIYLTQLTVKQELNLYFNNLMNLDVILPTLYLGVIASILGFFLVNYSLSKLPAHVSSIYSNIATIVSVMAGFFFLNEAIEIYHLIGGVLIILGIYGTTRVNYLIKRKRLKYDQTH
ncbi:MAG TPA: EamA family transporter [Candidatus Izemoplasmatales bacterium]|nr:EamA family transporter [Candidatus Izemoplasmatales bacterium]